jgi:hypothetical protein
MQTLTERYGKKRVWAVIACAWAVVILVGAVKVATDDGGVPTCAKVQADPSAQVSRNDEVACMDEIDKWCHDNHPDDRYCDISLEEKGWYDDNWVNHPAPVSG